jgi:hypothetical protein
MIEITLYPDGTRARRSVGINDYGRGMKINRAVLVCCHREPSEFRFDITYLLIQDECLVFLTGSLTHPDFRRLETAIRQVMPPGQYMDAIH